MNAQTETVTMEQISEVAHRYQMARGGLTELIGSLQQELEDIRAEFLPAIKKAVAIAAAHESQLRELIEAAPQLFERPRTQIFFDVKVGFRKGAGGIDWDNDAKVVERIREHFPKAQAELLIKTTEKPIAKAIQDLDVADIRKIGCRVEATGDVVVIKPLDGEVEKLVDALLKDAAKEDA